MKRDTIIKTISVFCFAISIKALALQGEPNCNEPSRGRDVGELTRDASEGPTLHFDGYSMLNSYEDQDYINRMSQTTHNGGPGFNGYNLKIFAIREQRNVLLFVFATDNNPTNREVWLPLRCFSGSVQMKTGHYMIVRRDMSAMYPLNITANGGNGSDGSLDYYSKRRGHGGNAGSGGNIEVIYADRELIQNLNFVSKPGKAGRGEKGEEGWRAKLRGTTSGENGKEGVQGTVSFKRVEPAEIDVLLSEHTKKFSEKYRSEYIYNFDSNYVRDLNDTQMRSF